MDDKTIILQICEDGDFGSVCTLDQFKEANVDDPDLVKDVQELDLYEDIVVGGGAQPIVEIKRVS